MKTIDPVHKIEFELDNDDLKEMIVDYYKKKLDVTLDIETIRWDIKEKPSGQYTYYSNTDYDDIMMFSHLQVNAQPLNK